MMRLLTHAIPGVVVLACVILCEPSNTYSRFQDTTTENPFSVVIRCTNPSDFARSDELVAVEIASLRRIDSRIGSGGILVREAQRVVASQLEDTNGDGNPDVLLVLIDLQPHESKTLGLFAGDPSKPSMSFTQRTQADLAIKVDYVLKDGFYTGGRFVGVTTARTPDGHTMHNAYFKYEGPGWESDRVGYRLYLDERNRCDIFGKKTRDMVLHTVGVNDLVSNGQESYQSMQPWGRDMFKVATSLGIGSPAMWFQNTVVPIQVTDSARCTIAASGPINSTVALRYYGWKVGKSSWDLDARFSIGAGSRLTHVDLVLRGPSAVLCTGLAKHAGCTSLRATAKASTGWGYIARYGKQTLSGDNLGTVLFYRKADLVSAREDSVNALIVVKPARGHLTYAFGAAWEQEVGGIRDLETFRTWCDQAVRILSEPIVVRVAQQAPR